MRRGSAISILIACVASFAFAGGAGQNVEERISLAQGENLGLQKNEQYVISAAELLQEVGKNPKLVLIDARRNGNYSGGFIPGAVNIFPREDLDRTITLENGAEVPLILREIPEVQSILRNVGISQDSKVVIYASGVNSEASRIFWVLDYLGHTNIALLDGGIEAWRSAGGELSKEVPSPTPGDFVARPNADRIASYEYVKSIQGSDGTILCDALPENSFNNGAIPGSVNLPYTFTFTDGAYLRSAEELEALLLSVGYSPEKELVFYCGAGYTASQNYFIARYLGIEKVRNYDGSRNEWRAIGDVLTPAGRDS